MPRTIEKPCNPQDWVQRAAYCQDLTPAQFRFLVMASELARIDIELCLPSLESMSCHFAAVGHYVPVAAHAMSLMAAGWLYDDPLHKGLVLTFPVWTHD